MSILKAADSKKWIHSFVVIVAVIVGHLLIRLMEQLGEWFDLESKVPHYLLVSQGCGIVLGLATFLFLVRYKVTIGHMQEVYDELVKVIWPDNNSVVRSTIGIIIALAIISGVFVGVDFIFRKVLELFY